MLPFTAYGCDDIGTIIKDRLARLPGKVFAPAAISFCARKVPQPVSLLLIGGAPMQAKACHDVGCHRRCTIQAGTSAAFLAPARWQLTSWWKPPVHQPQPPPHLKRQAQQRGDSWPQSSQV